MTLNEEITLLENNGWTVECVSPFEIRHDESNSFATGIAAEMILDSYKKEEKKKTLKYKIYGKQDSQS